MESNGTLWSEKPKWSQPDFLRWNKFKESSGSRLDQGLFFNFLQQFKFSQNVLLSWCCYIATFFASFFKHVSQFHKLVFSLSSSSHTLHQKRSNMGTWGCKKNNHRRLLHEMYEMHEAEIQRNLIEWHLQGQSRGNTSVSLCIVKGKISRSCWKRNETIRNSKL